MALIAGKISVRYNGSVILANGSWRVNPGRDRNEILIGADRVHGHKTMPQAAYVEGEVRVDGNLNVQAMLDATNAAVVVEFANGQTFYLNNAVQVGPGEVSTEDALLTVRYEGTDGGFIGA